MDQKENLFIYIIYYIVKLKINPINKYTKKSGGLEGESIARITELSRPRFRKTLVLVKSKV